MQLVGGERYRQIRKLSSIDSSSQATFGWFFNVLNLHNSDKRN